MYEQLTLTACPVFMTPDSLAGMNFNVHFVDHCWPDVILSIFDMCSNQMVAHLFSQARALLLFKRRHSTSLSSISNHDPDSIEVHH